MPLLRQVSLAEIHDEDIRAHFRRTFGDRDPVTDPGTDTGTPGDWWTTFALAPDVLRNSADFLMLAADPESKLSIEPRYRELGVLRQAWVTGCRFIYSQHCKFAREHAGLSDEKVSAIPHWQVSELFTPAERALLAYADALASEHGRVDPEIIAVLQQYLSDEAILEFSYITALYMAHGTIVKALRLEYDNVDDAVVEVPVPRERTEGVAL
jgi:alkylhydroperoxidase family enzyme